MGREKLEPGSWGEIQVAGYVEDGVRTYTRASTTPGGEPRTITTPRQRRAKDGETPTVWRATCSYRGKDGRTRRASVWSTHKTKAAPKLRRRMRKMVGEFASTSPRMTVEQLGRKWLTWFEENSKARPQTIDQYRAILQGPIIDRLGGYELRELTVGLLTRALEDMSEDAPSRARKARIILKHLYKYAIQNDYTD